ncbi:hypothetical protein LIER_16058 [Lithospermum erythrorhizon]|uniref:Uncharacterized protein n=1 Tax=Lithospermum erythrorhizon TaxID=34254 RepID=A0AAV3Q556_LITER
MDTSSIRIELVSEKLITPSSPTPEHLRHYKLSFLDQLVTTKYIPVTLFYTNTSISSSEKLSSILEESLSKLLSFYYPYAGKIVDNIYVDCNDRGALFKEVRIKTPMCETLANEFSNTQELPGSGFCCKEPSEEGPLAVVILSHFECGGIAITLALTHKLGDGYTTCKFYSDWAQLARTSITNNPPLLTGSSLLQPKDDPFTPNLYDMGNNHHLSFIRLRFDLENIKLLKDIASSKSDVNDPTSFEVVAALVNKCATIAGRSNIPSSSSSLFDPFTIYIPMNLRKLIDPAVENLVGNFLSFVLVDVSSEDELELPKLVSKIRKEKLKHMEKYQGKNNVEILGEIKEEARKFPMDSKLRLATSFSAVKLYDIDFGWGRPARVTLEAIRSNNYFVMLSAPDKGGIDVIASLDPSIALKFKTNKALLQFSSVDPTS